MAACLTINDLIAGLKEQKNVLAQNIERYKKEKQEILFIDGKGTNSWGIRNTRKIDDYLLLTLFYLEL